MKFESIINSHLCVFMYNVPPTASKCQMEMEPRLKVSSDRQEKPETEPATPGLQGEWFIHCTGAAPNPHGAIAQ